MKTTNNNKPEWKYDQDGQDYLFIFIKSNTNIIKNDLTLL